MNKLIRLGIFVSLVFYMMPSFGQISEDSIKIYNDTISDFRKGKNIKLMYMEGTPLTPEQHKNFKGLKYYPIDIKFQIVGKLVKSENAETVVMRTSTERAPEYIDYGVITFEFDGTAYSLKAYRSKKYMEVNPDDNTLFVPFRDETSGKETYGGGRYIDCSMPETGDQVILDFNKAYNPYCAYNSRYSCVIPPEENRLPFAIKAGEKIFEEHH